VQNNIDELINNHYAFFKTKRTLDYKYRILYLKKLYKEIKNNIDLINESLYKDLGKSKSEACMCEIGLVLSEISYMLKHIKKWTKPRKKRSPLAQFRAVSFLQ